MTTDAQTRAERIESEAQVNAERVQADALSRAESARLARSTAAGPRCSATWSGSATS